MTDDLTQINFDIANHEKALKLAKSLEALRNNRDFKELVEGEYLVMQAAQLTWARAYDVNQTDDKRQAIDRALDAIAYFRQYLLVVERQGKVAEPALASAVETRNQMRMEESNG